jgi:hypothetical protein
MTKTEAPGNVPLQGRRRPLLAVFTPVTRHREMALAAWVENLAASIDILSAETLCETANSLALLCLRTGRADYTIDMLLLQLIAVDVGVCPPGADIGALLNLVRLSFRCNEAQSVDQRVGWWSKRYRRGSDDSPRGRYAGQADDLIAGTLIEEELRCEALASLATWGSLLPRDDSMAPEALQSLLREREMLAGHWRRTRLPCPLFDEVVFAARFAAALPFRSTSQRPWLAAASRGLLDRLDSIDHRWWRAIGTTVVSMSQPDPALRELYEDIIRTEPELEERIRGMLGLSRLPRRETGPAVNVELLWRAAWRQMEVFMPDARRRLNDQLREYPQLVRFYAVTHAARRDKL